MTHHFVMTSSLRIKILKIDNFSDFSCDIDYNSRTDIFRDAISLIINQCDPTRPKGVSGGHKMSPSRATQACDARLYICIYANMNRVLIVSMYICIYIYICTLRLVSLRDWRTLCVSRTGY